MSLAIRIVPEPLRVLGEASISGTYAAIGTAFAHPIRIVKIYNGTDVGITFSFDGTHDHEFLPSGGFVLLDVCANEVEGAGAFLAQGTTVYAKGTPSMGSVYVSCYYGSTANEL